MKSNNQLQKINEQFHQLERKLDKENKQIK